jgi:hypothetical protein
MTPAYGAVRLPLQRAAPPLGHREFACQAKRRRLCKLIAFGSFPRHRSVVVVAAGRLGGGNERRELTRGRDERPFRRLPCAMRGVCGRKRECASPAGGRRARPKASRRRFEWRPSNGDEVESAEFQGRDARIARIDPHNEFHEFAGGFSRPASLPRGPSQRGRPVAIFPPLFHNPTHRRRSRDPDAPNESVAGRVVAPRENLPCQTR